MVRSYVTVLAAALVAASATMEVAYSASPSLPPADGGHTVRRERTMQCSEGQRLLQRQGFQRVQPLDCRGIHFLYTAQRGGERYEIVLDGRDGRIVDLRRVR